MDKVAIPKFKHNPTREDSAQLSFPLDKKGQDEINDALARGSLLPRAPFLCALGDLAALFRAFQNEAEVAEDDKIDLSLLHLTGEAASVPQGRADDHSNDGKSLVNYLLTAKREDAELAARQYETGLKTLHFGTFGPGAAAVPEAANRLGAPPSGPHSLKRKARDGHSTMQPFRSVPSSGPSRGDGSAPQRFTGPGATSGGGERRQEHFCTA
ncbi:unnamed protein product [Tilletia laevis]|uniref:Uncharacterized protein n=1 Tax=Tilletia laevis TaxID=157183 RepID=A0A9N8LJ19_9BASI|nr:unnamed protein product [Tilletia laevis]